VLIRSFPVQQLNYKRNTMWAGTAQSVQWFATGWTGQGSKPGWGGEIFRPPPLQTSPGAHPASCTRHWPSDAGYSGWGKENGRTSIWSCVRVGKLLAYFYPILPDFRKCTCPSDKIMVPWRNATGKTNRSTRIKTRPTATLSTTRHTAFLRRKFAWIPFKHSVRTAQ